jgi:hypothetical protein
VFLFTFICFEVLIRGSKDRYNAPKPLVLAFLSCELLFEASRLDRGTPTSQEPHTSLRSLASLDVDIVSMSEYWVYKKGWRVLSRRLIKVRQSP